MKLFAYVLIALLLLSAAFAEKVILETGSSHSDEGKNFTLLKIENRKALVCVNNQKGIASFGKRTDINGIIIELTKIYSNNSAKFDIEIPNCYKCQCTGDCLNLVCTEPKQAIQPAQQQQTQLTAEKQQSTQLADILEPAKISATSIIAVILIILVILLGIYVLWKKIY